MMPMPLVKLAASVALCPGVMLAGAAAKLSIVAEEEEAVYPAVPTPTPQAAEKRSKRIGSTVCRNIGDLRLRARTRSTPRSNLVSRKSLPCDGAAREDAPHIRSASAEGRPPDAH